MVIFKTVNDVRSQVKEWKKQGLKVRSEERRVGKEC